MMMQIVINIDEENYEKNKYGRCPVTVMRKAIRNGIPLPKNHGRLIDADKLELDDGYSNYDGYYHKYSQSQIYNAPTIIEADKEE